MDGDDVAGTGMDVIQSTRPASLASDDLADNDVDGLIGYEVREDDGLPRV